MRISVDGRFIIVTTTSILRQLRIGRAARPAPVAIHRWKSSHGTFATRIGSAPSDGGIAHYVSMSLRLTSSRPSTARRALVDALALLARGVWARVNEFTDEVLRRRHATGAMTRFTLGWCASGTASAP
jgi:hypothetical protein